MLHIEDLFQDEYLQIGMDDEGEEWVIVLFFFYYV